MGDIAVRVENLSKRYRIGNPAGYGMLREAIADWVRRPGRRRASEEASHVWALKNVTFDIGRGEVWGILGRNGSGKSTLLKILSRVTQPSSGLVEMQGRVNSLLEVGTGFHPELTGRENIFLNATILGMTTRQVQRRFDEIVEFSEIGRFIDTPVKHYSSGMYVRLAFSVAAHCEPDILLVDEVLAVGDLPFQAKCLARIEQLASTASAVLFVSHNLANVKRLCSKALWLEEGAVVREGQTDAVVDAYVAKVGGAARMSGPLDVEFAPSTAPMHITRLRVLDRTGDVAQSEVPLRGPFIVEIAYTVLEPLQSAYVLFRLVNSAGVEILWTYDGDSPEFGHRKPGRFVATAEVPAQVLAAGVYTVHCAVVGEQGVVVDHPKPVLSMEVAEVDCLLARRGVRWPAATRVNPEWTTRQML